MFVILSIVFFFFFQAEDGIRDAQESRGLGDVYKRQTFTPDSPVKSTESSPIQSEAKSDPSVVTDMHERSRDWSLEHCERKCEPIVFRLDNPLHLSDRNPEQPDKNSESIDARAAIPLISTDSILKHLCAKRWPMYCA
eukprot:TRINITY_DN18207_c0_g1_i2.p2 TRINITY_DN18207_c0_g1~~TRINITY_DN18207_c0_g1_i2.p2  ORF type:complete len:138 (+),score=29.40 TRINITY_DN18207_c0_g1_i2:56-469(+)